jgi:hypothetical protein
MNTVEMETAKARYADSVNHAADSGVSLKEKECSRNLGGHGACSRLFDHQSSARWIPRSARRVTRTS